MGTIGEAPVRFFLDSGADLTVINKQTLDELRYVGMTTPSQQSDVTIKGVHGQETSLPVVHLDCKIMGRIFTLPMTVSDDIRHDVILGRDCDILYALMKTAIENIPQDVLVVQTRQQAAAENHCQQQNADASEELLALHPDIIGDDFLQTNLSLPDTSTDPSSDPDFDPLSQSNADSEALRRDQRNDPTLAEPWSSADQENSPYITKHGILHRQSADRLGEPIWQIVLPVNRRQQVLDLAHSTPMAGHGGHTRTKYKILKHFFWPHLAADVKATCKPCDHCQKTAKRTHSRAPMVSPPPHITRPFDKVAIDVVGPLPMTKSKNRYILTYIDLGSRYPDTVPLSTTTADVIAKALLNIMSRLSVPLEILSDRGSNFLSSVMKETFKFLGILQSKTAPYRPQSNGAIERFHHTLMKMVRKSAADHRDWDEHLQYLLFACREAPCSSTGFSPFELLFGREVHGPLDILRQQWVPAKTTSTTVTEWLLKLRTDLTEIRALAINHQENTWFDRSATATSFHKGDQVLVFTPAFAGHRSQKLEDRWCGPYTILGSLSPVTYPVDMP